MGAARSYPLPTTYNLARMNMILHGVHYLRFDLKNEDTLEHPAPEHADLRFEAIVANPPFSARSKAWPSRSATPKPSIKGSSRCLCESTEDF